MTDESRREIEQHANVEQLTARIEALERQLQQPAPRERVGLATGLARARATNAALLRQKYEARLSEQLEREAQQRAAREAEREAAADEARDDRCPACGADALSHGQDGTICESCLRQVYASEVRRGRRDGA